MRSPKIVFFIGLIAFILGIVLIFAVPVSTTVTWDSKSETLVDEENLVVTAAWQSKDEVLVENQILSVSPKWQSKSEELVDTVLSVPTWMTYYYTSVLTPYYGEAKDFVISGNVTEKSYPQVLFNFYIFDYDNFNLWETNKTYTAFYEAKGKTSSTFNFSIAEEDISDWFYFVVEEHNSDLKPTISVSATISWIEKSYLYDYVDYCSFFGLSSFEETRDIVVEGNATEVGDNEFNFYMMDYSNYYSFITNNAYSTFYEAKNVSVLEFSVPLAKTQASSSIYFVVENPNLDIDEVISTTATIRWIEKSPQHYCMASFTSSESTNKEVEDFVLNGTATEENNYEFSFYIFDETNYFLWESSSSYTPYYEAKNVTTTSFSTPLLNEEATLEIFFVAENSLTDVDANVKISATLEWVEKTTVGGIGISTNIIGIFLSGAGFLGMVIAGILFLVSKPSTRREISYPQMEPKERLGVVVQNRCPSCNTILEVNDKFCPECGTPISKELEKVAASRSRKTVAELASLFIGGIAYLYFRTYIGLIALFVGGVVYMVLRPFIYALLDASDKTEQSNKQDEEGHKHSATS